MDPNKSGAVEDVIMPGTVDDSEYLNIKRKQAIIALCISVLHDLLAFIVLTYYPKPLDTGSSDFGSEISVRRNNSLLFQFSHSNNMQLDKSTIKT